jgi:hypothetical protein
MLPRRLGSSVCSIQLTGSTRLFVGWELTLCISGLTTSLAAEYAPAGVRVNAIVPGYIATDMTKGMKTPETDCGLGYFLVSAPPKPTSNLVPTTRLWCYGCCISKA